MKPKLVVRRSAIPVLNFWLVLCSLLALALIAFDIWKIVQIIMGEAAWNDLIVPAIPTVIFMIPMGIQLWKIIEIKYHIVEFYDNKIVKKRGVFVKLVQQNVLSAVYSVNVYQSIMGRIFNYGDLQVDCAGNWDLSQRNIKHPKKVERFLQSRISSEGMTHVITN